MRMKPWIALLLTAAMVLSLTACGAIIPRNQPNSSNSPASSEPPITTAAPVPLDILKTGWEKWDMDTGDMDMTGYEDLQDLDVSNFRIMSIGDLATDFNERWDNEIGTLG